MNDTQLKRFKVAMLLALLAACGPDVVVDPTGDMSMIQLDQGRDEGGLDQNMPDMRPDMKTDLADMTPDLGPCGAVCQGDTPVCDVISSACVPCLGNDDCAASSPNGDVCLIDATDPSMNRCVGCTVNNDCLIPGQPTSPDDELTCDPGTNTCVQCLSNTECVTEEASLCVDNACTACTADTDCSHLPDGKTVCDVDAGICRGCMPENEEINCGGNTCDPANFKCTETVIDSLANCDPCVSDSDCDGDAGCIDMTFGANNVDIGSYCLPKKGAVDCPDVYPVANNATTLSGISDLYCHPKVQNVSCSAILAQRNLVSCEMSQGGQYLDECGAPGLDDGLCVLYNNASGDYQCSIVCENKKDCQASEKCKSVNGQMVCVQN